MTWRPLVTVCGSSGDIAESVRQMAFEVGKGLAEQGLSVVCGGRDGVMAAVCHGVHSAVTTTGEARGHSIGLLPGSDRSDANPWLDFVLPTGIGYARNSMVALAGDVVVLIGGATGTLAEAAYAWNYGKPMVALRPSGGVAADLAGSVMDSRYDAPILSAESPAEVVAHVLALLARGAP